MNLFFPKGSSREEALFRTLVENLPDLIARLDRDLRYIYLSPAVERITAKPVSAFLGTTMGQVMQLPLGTASRLRALAAEALETAKPQVLDAELSIRDGLTRAFEVRMIPETDSGGRPSTLLVVFRDIGDHRALAAEIRERREMEKWLVAARQAAVEGARLKSSFVANISHEIRTPIHAITGMLYALSETPLSEQQRKYAETIQKAADALMDLLNDVLDFSKIESGKLNLYFKEFDLRELLEQSTASFAREAQKKGLRWVVQTDPSLPSKLRSDSSRIRQVLTNLLGNAMKFTQAGEIVVQVKVESSRGSRVWVRFEVRDSGIGIPEAARPLIFEEFSQVDGSSSRKHGGVGLGLSICRKLVELMEGAIGYESELGKGSTFWFSIPMDLVALPAPLTEKPPKVSQPQISGRILLVEDNPVNQEVTATILASMGHQVAIAENGRRALELTRDQDFDLIIMDCQMPEMDGYETTRVLRESERLGGRDRRIPIIAMTADAMKDAAARCLASGMNDYVSKPVNVEALRDRLQAWLVPHAETVRTQARLDESAVENLKSFRTVGAPNLFVRLVEIYLDDAPPRALRMAEAVEQGNAKALEADAHYLKSASAALGAHRLSQICLEIEDLGKVYDPVRARRLLAEFRSEYDLAIAELRARVGR